jgi:UDP-glucuronate decarboxylase
MNLIKLSVWAKKNGYSYRGAYNRFNAVNTGNPGEFTMLELAEKVIDLTGSKSKLVFKTLPQDDPKQRRPDITVAKEKLGWEPKVGVDEGLKYTIEYFDQQLKKDA